MKLTTEYREKTTGVLKGTKQGFLYCHVEFSDKERAIVQERGLYDSLALSIPPATPAASRASDFLSMLLRGLGIFIMLIAAIASCGNGMMNALDGGHHQIQFIISFIFLIIGIVLFTIGKVRDHSANKRDENPYQQLTVRRLLTNPEFLVFAEAPDIAQMHEATVRERLSSLATTIRANAVVQEQTTYEL